MILCKEKAVFKKVHIFANDLFLSEVGERIERGAKPGAAGFHTDIPISVFFSNFPWICAYPKQKGWS